ncbi:MAG: hypothetical protein HF982_15370 [Desulfobacteraceae bacterium]|nr:hypothetical protein [Desulfobacteraceae bacterium]MBC2720937.1 hypothetical protein [Desulfobacteraceae bacterium]
MSKINFSRKKRYLSGIDWIIHALDYITKKAIGTGNTSQIVLELEGSLQEDKFRTCLDSLIKKYPVLYGRPSRNYNLAPYWKIFSKRQSRLLPVKVYHLEYINHTNIFKLLEQKANLKFINEQEHLFFHLIHAENKTYVAMTFDHRLFDALGAEAFLEMLQNEWKNKDNSFCDKNIIVPAESAHLCNWRRKFIAGQQANRAFLKMSKNAPPRVLPLPASLNNLGFRFKVIPFDKYQTDLILENAYKDAGYLMLMPYVLASAIWVIHRLFSKRNIKSGDYVVPVSIDMRPTDKVQQEVFFNHVSFLFFIIRSDEAEHFPFLIKSIKQQLYDQVKSGLPSNFQEASLLMRILPLPILSNIMRLYLKGQIASFSFSNVGEGAYRSSNFMGKKILNIFHMPRVPVPPGLGIFFHQFQNKLNVVLSFLEGILSDKEANELIHTLQSRLGEK